MVDNKYSYDAVNLYERIIRTDTKICISQDE